MEKICFSDATEALRAYLSSKGRAENTRRAYQADLKMFWQEMNLEEISLADLEKLASDWLNSKRRTIAPKTTHRRLTTMKNLALAFKTRILDDYTTPTPSRPTPHPLPGGLEDLNKLFSVCFHEQHRVLIALTGLVGMRIHEALNAKPSDFDHATRQVTIWGKGDRIRKIPVSTKAMEILMPSLIEASISGRSDTPLIQVGDRSARELITILGERAKLSRRISSHDLRATFATVAYAKSKDLRAVQELLGHADSKQTETYVLVSDQALRTAANIME